MLCLFQAITPDALIYDEKTKQKQNTQQDGK